MDVRVTLVNITAAALITQFSLTLIMLVAAVLLRTDHGHQFWLRREPMAWIILLAAMTTIGFLVFSDQFIPIWQPLFGDVPFPSVRSSTAISTIFVVDSLCTALLVSISGGSRVSAFSPIFFMVPALAIFLREPFAWVVAYLLLVSGLFSVCLLDLLESGESGSGRERLAYWFVAIACLVLTTLIGYVTRPR